VARPLNPHPPLNAETRRLAQRANGFAFQQIPSYIDAMSSGRINSKGSIDTASRVLRSYNGSWAAVERAATRDANGVYVVQRKPSTESPDKAHGPRD